jgi:peptide/nickel transport system substrate-binding protein
VTLSRRCALALGAGGLAALAPRGAGGAPAPRAGGVLKVLGAEPASFDVHEALAAPTQLLSSLVRRTLFKLDLRAAPGPAGLPLRPDLALRAEVARDGRTVALVLRRGVRWDDRPPLLGREVTSADVRYSLERVLRRSARAGRLGRVEAVEAPGRHVVRVRLAEPFPPLLHALAEPWTAIVPPEIEERLGDLRSAASLLGCGPFALARHEPGVKAVLTRNPTYYQPGRPLLDRVDWILLADRATQLSLFRAGQVDLPAPDGRVPRAQVAALQAGWPRPRIRLREPLTVRALAFRTDRPPFSDVRVRRAFSLAIDRRSWVSELFEGQGSEDASPLPAALPAWRLSARELGDGARWLAHDPAQARALLAAAGFPGGLRVRCASWSGDGGEHAAELARLAASLRAAGIELQLQPEDRDRHTRETLLGRFEETAWGPSLPSYEVDGHLWGALRSRAPTNRSHVADPDLDALLDAQRRTREPGARRRLVGAIQRRAADQVYYVYTPSPRVIAAWASWVHGFVPAGALDLGAALEQVWLDRR